jgi:microcystin degradation protein MlrC
LASPAGGGDNVLILSTYLVRVIEPFSLRDLGLDIGAFKVMAIKSRVHFRRGFHDNGFAKMIVLVEPPEPPEPFLGTVGLDALPYQNVDLKRHYPYGDPTFRTEYFPVPAGGDGSSRLRRFRRRHLVVLQGITY